ncbi:MAG: hypothetical protein JSW41_02225 [Candidatus Aenigmatarchaeota archaeon]|nr:MAG: hypothetical protein JSW41_02225 [Candidatus Aenigmarchaeota archaeon]
MDILKSRLIVLVITFLIGLIPLYVAYLHVIRYLNDPVAMFILPESVTIIVLVIILGIWVFFLSLTGQRFFEVKRKRKGKQKEIENLRKRIKKMKTSIKVAQVEYFKSRITKKMLDKMLSSYEKEMVDIKARLKELGEKTD